MEASALTKWRWVDWLRFFFYRRANYLHEQRSTHADVQQGQQCAWVPCCFDDVHGDSRIAILFHDHYPGAKPIAGGYTAQGLAQNGHTIPFVTSMDTAIAAAVAYEIHH